MNSYNSAGGNLNCVTLSDYPTLVAAAKSQRRTTSEWLADPRELDKLGSALFRLSWMLSLPLICLVLANLAWAATDNAKGDRSDTKTTLKKGTDRQELLANVRAALGNKIRKELITLPQYDVFDNVNFLLDENEIVTLSGHVRLPSLKVSAERVVRNVEGVRGVINQIEVLPTSAFDDDIRRVAFLQIYSHSQLSRYGLQAVPPIHIIVKNGQLTLEGIVATESDKTIAGIRANEVSNVFAVVNNLRVQGQ
jgi:hyperosmotically inducible protein